jgi:2-C-methyl-D-erythritol 4-phosphate cytidylyltransferase
MGGWDKIFGEVAGRPLLAWVVGIFQDCASVHQIVIVVNEKSLEAAGRLVTEQGWSKVREVCPGGRRRQDSVAQGLKRLGSCHWVVIHDGARPCLSVDVIERGLGEVAETGAAVAAVPVKDTIKIIGPAGAVQETPSRDKLWAAQTPQLFRFDIIDQAYRQATGEVTDDATLVEEMGYRVKVYMGSYRNIKVTTPEDLALAEALLREGERG